MLRTEKHLRLTPREAESCRQVGFDTHGVKTPDAFANAIEPWFEALAEVRPDIFDKIAQKLADAKDLKLPPQLSVANSDPASDCLAKS